MTSSSLRHPLPTKASFGWRYLWNVFLITESLFTLMPTCSSNALIFVFDFYSPPSHIIIIHRPPSSIYCLMCYNSYALKGILGPPSNKRWHSLSLLSVISVLLMSHYSEKWLVMKVWYLNTYLVSRLQFLYHFLISLVGI